MEYGTQVQVDLEKSIVEHILKERRRQAELWGPQNHSPEKWMTILGEEFGEACKGLLQGDRFNYREELIQVAAVAVAAITNMSGQRIDRWFVVDALAPPGSKP